MNWAGLAQFYGLRRPFNFGVAALLLTSGVGFALVLIISILLFICGALSVGTERFYFLCYLATLLLIAAVFSRVVFVSFVISLWCAIELSVAFSSAVLSERGFGESLLSSNTFTQAPDPRFEYHALLGRVPKANWRGEWHFDRRNEKFIEAIGWPVNPEEFYRDTFFAHNSLGLRGKELSADDLMKDLIFMDGGSTTYDYNVTQGATWVEQLDAALKNNFTILNFGVPFHSTTQHLAHTAFHHEILQKRPVCAIYYVGWNDLLNAHAENLDPMYASSLSLLMTVRKPDIWAARYSPLLRLGNKLAKRRLDSIPELPPKRVKRSAIDDGRLERFFVEHVRTIATINDSRGVKTIYIGQMINRELLNLTPEMESLSTFKNREVWPMIQHFNSILKRTSASVGAHYIDAGIENFNNNHFADAVHFSAAGSKKFTSLISDEVESYCQRSAEGATNQ